MKLHTQHMAQWQALLLAAIVPSTHVSNCRLLGPVQGGQVLRLCQALPAAFYVFYVFCQVHEILQAGRVKFLIKKHTNIS